MDAKDLALKTCRELTISGANYAALEYHGLDWLSLPERQTLASMAVEVGAKVGLVPPQGAVEAEFSVPGWLRLDPQVEYQKTLQIDLDKLPAQISIPHAVDHVVDLDQVAGQPVNVVFLGTCTNGRYEDLRIAAQTLKGKRIAAGVRKVVTPASSRELARAAADGSLGILLRVDPAGPDALDGRNPENQSGAAAGECGSYAPPGPAAAAYAVP